MMNVPMHVHVGQNWWLVALRGAIAIIFGILAFVWPGVTLLVLIAFFAAYMFIDGIMALVQAIRFRHERERWPALLIEGIIGIAAGAVTYLWPGITALAWVFTIAAWAVLTGILEIMAAVRLRKIISGEIFLALSGVASIILGIIFAFMPRVGLLTSIYVIGAYAIIFGILLISLAFRLRSITHTPVRMAGT